MNDSPSDEPRVAIDVSPARAEEFCLRLAHDDDFRAQVEADPRGMLAAYGVEISEELHVPDTVTLPSKEVLQNLLDVIREPLFGGGSHAFVMICKVFPAFPLVASDEEGGGAR